MSDDDPFGLSSDAGRTRVRPPQAERASARAPGEPGPAVAGPRPARASANPLIVAFGGLLALAPELERASPPANPESLRARLLDDLIRSRDAAVAEGASLQRANQAAWFVAALIDDIALNTPWGGASDWPRQPLVVSLSGEVDAGKRFFDHFDELMRFPERDPQVLELAYTCLALGFRGKHRVSGATGEAALAQIRAQAARLLRRRDDADATLSPNAEGVVAPDRPPRFAVPLWSIGLVTLAVIAAVYVALGLRLSDRAERLYALANVLPPPERAAIFRPVRATGAPEPQIPPPVVIELLPSFSEAVPPPLRGAIEGREDAALTTLVLQGTDPELFRSARAEIEGGYAPLIAAIAEVIRQNLDLIGGITVIGHTDSIPVQRSNPLASNQRLSEARAETIARMLADESVPASLIKAEGRAASEPIGDNATREGRARNRRVEIRIEKRV